MCIEMNEKNKKDQRKAKLRKLYRERAEQFQPQEREQANRALKRQFARWLRQYSALLSLPFRRDHLRGRYQNAPKVMIYRPFRDEPPVERIVEGFGFTLFYPEIAGTRLRARRTSHETGKTVEEPLSGMNLIIVPGLLFTEEGFRLGRGKGYYDRVLAHYPRKQSLMIAYHWQKMPALPHEKHDRRVGHWLTDLEFGAARYRQ